MSDLRVINYVPSNQWQHLVFDGDERKYKSWATKILSYLKLKGLKEVFGIGETSNDKLAIK